MARTKVNLSTDFKPGGALEEFKEFEIDRLREMSQDGAFFESLAANEKPGYPIDLVAHNAEIHLGGCSVQARDIDPSPFNVHPKQQAWIQIEEMATLMASDTVIQQNGEAVKFLEVICKLASKASKSSHVESIFASLFPYAIAGQNRKIANTKNAEEKQWVLEQWKAKTNKSLSKQAFAKQHAALVKSKFQLEVSADTIARYWLS